MSVMPTPEPERPQQPEGGEVTGFAGIFIAVCGILPLLVIFAWNVGIAGIAHVQTIHSYWTALGLVVVLLFLHGIARMSASRPSFIMQHFHKND